MEAFRARNLAAAVFAGGLIVMSSSTVLAASGAETLAVRKAVMQSIGAHFGAALAAIKSGDAARMKAAARQASAIGTLSTGIAILTPKNSGSSAGKSRALPKIWQDWAGYKKAAAALTAEAGKLAAAMKTGNAKVAISQFGRTGKVGCGGCHSPFRAKKKKK